MKYLDKLINFIFSLVILVLTAIIVLVSAGFIEYNIVDNYIRNNIFSLENNTITCIVAIVVFGAALKTTFFLSKTNNKKKTNIMVDTTHGMVQIAQETIESTAKNVVKNYEEIKDAQVRMMKEKRAVNIYMSLLVLPHTNIIELSSKVQDEVKEAIRNTTGVKVNNVDIKIKNIAETRSNINKSKAKIENEKIVEQNPVILEESDNTLDEESTVIEESKIAENNENTTVVEENNQEE